MNQAEGPDKFIPITFVFSSSLNMKYLYNEQNFGSMGYTISDPDCIIDYSQNRFCPAKEKIQGYKKHSRVFFVIFLQKTIFKQTKKKTLKSGDFCTVERAKNPIQGFLQEGAIF